MKWDRFDRIHSPDSDHFTLASQIEPFIAPLKGVQ